MTAKSIIGRIGSYLFGETAAGAGEAEAVAEARRAALKPNLPPRLPAGSMQLIGLGSIQKAIGDAWPAQAEQIYRRIDSVLRRRLEATDAFYRVDTENYLILFTRLARREAEFKARVIAEEIQRLVFSDMAAGADVTVHSAVADIDRGVILEKIGSLTDLLDYVRSQAMTQSGDITLFRGAGDNQSVEASPAVVGAGPDMADLDQPLTGLFQKKTVAAYLKECRAGFYPAFSLKRRSFSSYHTAILHEPTGKPAGNQSDPFLEATADVPFQLDRFALTAGLLGAHRMLTGGKQGIVMIPVSFDTLAVSKQREIYLTRLKEVPAGVTRFVGITIRDIPPGTMASRIAEIISYIQPFCNTRLLRLPADSRLIELYADTGCHGFATWIPEDSPDIAKPFQLLSGFTKRAGLHRLECILTDIASHDGLSAGIAAGFTFLSGEAVAGMIETPGFLSDTKTDHIQRQSGHAPVP
jgi:hypothetical protein